MKAIVLQKDAIKTIVSSEMKNELVSFMLTNKEDEYRFTLSSYNRDNTAKQWVSGVLKDEEELTIGIENVRPIELSEGSMIVDYNNPSSVTQRMLESYYKLKEELEADGMI